MLLYWFYPVRASIRDPQKISILMRSLARNIATIATLETLRKDIAGAEADLAVNTVQSYLEVFERLFVVENQPAWSTRLRSKAYLRKAPKRHLSTLQLLLSRLIPTPTDC